jgi:mannonate dehydratase
MKLGERLSLDATLSEENLSYLKQLDVNYVMAGVGAPAGRSEKLPINSKLRQGDYFAVDDLLELKKWVASRGFGLFGLSHTPFSRWDKIIMNKPGRDQQIENWCTSLRNMGKAGITMLQYNWVIDAAAWLSNWRTTDKTIGRGGARYYSFDYEVAKKVPVTAEFGVITEEEMWANLAYFLKAVIPAAAQAGVKMVVHPADPQVPSIAGVARIIRSPEAYDRLFTIVPSDYSGMVFCIGCFSQILEPDGVYEAITHFGAAKKIGYVHFRNVSGTRERFDEVYPDEGKLDMFKCIRLLTSVGYNDIIIPDHTPHGMGDTEYGHRGRAYAIGYMKGLMQAVGALDK